MGYLWPTPTAFRAVCDSAAVLLHLRTAATAAAVPCPACPLCPNHNISCAPVTCGNHTCPEYPVIYLVIAGAVTCLTIFWVGVCVGAAAILSYQKFNFRENVTPKGLAGPGFTPGLASIADIGFGASPASTCSSTGPSTPSSRRA